MKLKLSIAFVFILLISTFSLAVEFIPQGDIQGKNTYKIYNFTNISATRLYQNGNLVLDNSTVINQWLGLTAIDTTTMQNSTGTLGVKMTYLDSIYAKITDFLNYYTKTEVNSLNADQNITINTKLTATDQRYNDTALITQKEADRIGNDTLETNNRVSNDSTKAQIGSSSICPYGVANITLNNNSVVSVTCATQQGTGTSNLTTADISTYSGWNVSGTDVILATTSNQVGIGDTSPDESLDVVGNVQIRGNSYGFKMENTAANEMFKLYLMVTSNNTGIDLNSASNHLIFDPNARGSMFGIGMVPTTPLEVSGTAKATEFNGALNWTYLQNYPTACTSGSYVTGVGDTLTCTANNNGTVTSVSGAITGTSAVVLTGSPITSSGTLSIAFQNATAAQDGLLKSTDFSTFNSKLSSGGTLTSSNVCQYDGSGIDCNLVQDGSGDCSASAVCTGGHTHSSYATLASPTFTGTVTIPTPFTLGATSVTTTGTQLNYLNAATGTTGTTSTNLVFSTSPTLVTPTLGVASATSLTTTGDVDVGGNLTIGSGAEILNISNQSDYVYFDTGTANGAMFDDLTATNLYGNLDWSYIQNTPTWNNDSSNLTFSEVNGLVNSTSWNRSSTNVTLAHDGDSVIITGPSSSGATPYGLASNLVIDSYSAAGMSFLTPYSGAFTGYATLAFGDLENSYAGYLYYNHNGDYMLLGTNGSTQLTLNNTVADFTSDVDVGGNLTIGSGTEILNISNQSDYVYFDTATANGAMFDSMLYTPASNCSAGYGMIGSSGSTTWCYNFAGLFSPIASPTFTGTVTTPNLSISGNNVYMGSSDTDKYIYFYNAGSPDGEYIKWDDGDDWFEFSDLVYVLGQLTVQSSIRGDSDIYTTGSGDNIWTGTSTEASALFWAGADGSMKATNITITNVSLSVDSTNHKVYDNSTCIIIKGDTSTLSIC